MFSLTELRELYPSIVGSSQLGAVNADAVGSSGVALGACRPEVIDRVVHVQREVGVAVLSIEIHALNVPFSMVRLLLMQFPLLDGAHAWLHLSQLLEDFLVALIDSHHLILAIATIKRATHQVRVER